MGGGGVNISHRKPYFTLHLLFYAGYIVLYREEHAMQWSAEGIQGEDKKSLTLRRLRPNTVYNIKVQARTDKRFGSASPIIRYTTPGGQSVSFWVFVVLLPE